MRWALGITVIVVVVNGAVIVLGAFRARAKAKRAASSPLRAVTNHADQVDYMVELDRELDHRAKGVVS